jgi:hypothetical protein
MVKLSSRVISVLVSNRWSGIRRRWVLHPDAEVLTRLLAFPTYSLIQRIFDFDRSLYRAVKNARTAKPAFIRIQYNRRFAFFGAGDHHIGTAHFNALLAADTKLRANEYRLIWRHRVGYHIRFAIHTSPSLKVSYRKSDLQTAMLPVILLIVRSIGRL